MEDKMFLEEINVYNPRSMLFICRVILSIVGLNLLINIILQLKVDIEITPGIVEYSYVILYTLLSVYILIIFIYLKKNKTVSKRFISIFVYIVLLLSGAITLFDYIYYNHLLIYSILCILCANFIVLPKQKMKTIILICTILLIAAIFLMRSLNESYYLGVFYLFALSYFAVKITSGKFNLYREIVLSRIEIRKQMKEKAILVEQLQQKNNQLKQMALMDPLVGIPNRLAFNDYKQSLMKHVEDEITLSISIIIADVDYFKQYNDFYGHIRGDEVLQKIGRILRDVAQNHSVFVARWGGEEFIVVMEDCNVSDVEVVCQEIQNAMKQASMDHASSEVDGIVTLSIGAAFGQITLPEDFSKLLQYADDVLYRVKNKGRAHSEIEKWE